MNRRTFIRLGAAVGATASAGCRGVAPAASDSDGERSTPPTGDGIVAARHGVPPDLCSEAIIPDPGIDAILDPAFAPDWDGHEVDPAYRTDGGGSGLGAAHPVIGVSWPGGSRAYPLSILQYHEAVNDVAGDPLLVTYCPLCASGMVARRVVQGAVSAFAVTGLLWIPERILARESERRGRSFGVTADGRETAVRLTGNLVLYDARTHSYWSQLLARAVCGPATGEDLSIRPSTVATWADWRADHPETEVLLPPPHSETVEPGVVLGDG